MTSRRSRWAVRILIVAASVTIAVVATQGIVRPTDGECNDMINKPILTACAAPRDPIWPAVLAGCITAVVAWLLTSRLVPDRPAIPVARRRGFEREGGADERKSEAPPTRADGVADR
jgi:hypothetical protein